MDTQIKQELDSRLAELSAVVDSYDPTKEYFMTAMVLSLNIIGVIVILEVGILLGVVLIAVGILPLIYALQFSKLPPNEKELAKKACALMSSCVNYYKYSGDDPLSISRRMILECSSDGNLPLYQEFISIFPNMASKKLKKLAKVKYGVF